MPRRMKRGGKRAPRRYRRKAKKAVVVNRALAPIAQRYITKMKFAADVSTGADGFMRFNLNSIYDPLRSGSASPDQPYGRDTLATLYNRYRVISCGWRIQAPNTGGNIMVGCIPANETYTTTSFADIRENPRAKYYTQHATGAVQLLKGKVYIPSLVGRTKSQYMADDRYQSQIDANPVELAILNVGVAATNGGMLTTGQILNVLFEYTVEFFDIKTLTSS
nr:capsid protein [Cressdnaviricota sp.]